MSLFSNNGRIAEEWAFDTKSAILSSAAVGDFDGVPHIVIGTKDGRVICVNDLGEEMWSFKAGEQLGKVESYFVDEEKIHSIDSPPTIVDFNGKTEILFGTEIGILYCLSKDGKLLWKHDCGGGIRASAAVVDMNSDGHHEIMVGSTNNKLTVLTSEGKPLFEYINDSPIESVAGVLKGKKRTLIVFGDNKGTLTAITASQDPVWKVELGDKITAAPAFLSSKEEERLVIGTLGGNIVCVSEHGEIVWKYETEGSIYGQAAIADINNDNHLEIVFGSCDNNVYALTHDGQRLWSYETDFWIATSPIITDINNDNNPEVIVGSYDHNIYVLDGQGTYILDYVPGLAGIVHQAGHYSNLLTSEPGEQTGKKLFQYKMNSIIVGCCLLNRQGKPAIVVSTKAGQINTLRHEG